MSRTLIAWFNTDGPRWTYTRLWLHALAGAIGLTALVWFACSARGMSVREIFDENAAHELLQSAVLLIAAATGVAAIYRNAGLNRYAAMVVGLVSYVGFFREVPSCRADVVIFCAASETRGSLMAAGVTLLLVATIVFEHRSRGMIMEAIHPRLSWPLALTAALVGASQVSEALHMVFLEETLELYSYLVLLLSVGWLAVRPRSFSAAHHSIGAVGMRK